MLPDERPRPRGQRLSKMDDSEVGGSGVRALKQAIQIKELLIPTVVHFKRDFQTQAQGQFSLVKRTGKGAADELSQ